MNKMHLYCPPLTKSQRKITHSHYKILYKLHGKTKHNALKDRQPIISIYHEVSIEFIFIHKGKFLSLELLSLNTHPSNSHIIVTDKHTSNELGRDAFL